MRIFNRTQQKIAVAAATAFGMFSLSYHSVAGDATLPVDELFRDFYHCSYGRGEVQGNAVNDTDPKGETAIRIHYDFSKCPDAGNSFLRFHMDRLLPAKPKKIVLTLLNPGSKPVLLTAFTTDKNGEIYLGRAVSGTPDGNYETVELNLSDTPAWESGDRNRQVDYPLAWPNIMVEMTEEGDRVGDLFLKDAQIVTEVDAENCLGLQLAFEPVIYSDTRELPFEMQISALDPEIQGEYEVFAEVRDLYRGTTAAQLQQQFHLPLQNASWTLNPQWNLPYGSYAGRVELRTQAGSVMIGKDFTIQKLAPSCAEYSSEAEKKYEFQYGVNGGVHGFVTPEKGADVGMNWIRFEWPNWGDIETTPGEYDLAQYLQAIQPWLDCNIRVSILQCLYHYPKFADPKDLAAFSRGYGQYFKALTPALGDKVREFELGNEDNGHSKFVYTEVARNGAAAIRSENPFAVIGNSGTAFVDVNWLRFQASRGMDRYFDAYIVHPYTNNAAASQSVSPERFGTGQYLENLSEVVAETGGMKELWVTEFGWPNGDERQEHDRADLYLRQMLVTDASQVTYNGLYTWDRDYATMYRAAGAALHFYAKQRQGTIFVGQLMGEDGVYCNVYESPERGRFATLWTPDDDAKPMPLIAERWTDLFGNPLEATPQVSQSVVYAYGIPEAYYLEAAKANIESARKRLTQYVAATKNSRFERFATIPAEDAERWERELKELCSEYGMTISREEQSLLDMTLKTALLSETFFGATGDALEDSTFNATPYRQAVLESHAALLDAANVRYLLRLSERVEAERTLAPENAQWQGRCARKLDLLRTLLDTFTQYGERQQYAVFSNLYMSYQGETGEQLYFVPNQSSEVQCRVSNYSADSVTCSVTLDLPENWGCEPAGAELTIPANGAEWLTFTVSCPESARDVKSFRVVTQLGETTNVSVADRIELLPAIGGKVALMHNSAEQAPLRLQLSNLEGKIARGKIRVMPHQVAGGALAIVPFEIPARGESEVEVQLNAQAVDRLSAANDTLDLEFYLEDGRSFVSSALDVDFVVAAAVAPGEITVDGDLSDWKKRLPLKLNKLEQTLGSYGNGYSPEDCSATTYLAYDVENLYFGAVVKDQTFNQQMSSDSLWVQDSIQLVFAANRNATDFVGLTLAYCGDGSVIYHEGKRRYLNEAESVFRIGSEFVYETKIPWSALSEEIAESVKQNGSFCYGIAVNDDDAIVPRRMLEYFENSIIHGKDISQFGEVYCSPDVRASAKEDDKIVLEEDFSSYTPKSAPLGYAIRVGGGMNQEQFQIVAMPDGSQALTLLNEVPNTPHRFAIATMPMKLTPGKRYRLSALMEGAHESRVIGVCADTLGIIDFSYMDTPNSALETAEYTMEFAAPTTGELNLVLRNDAKFQNFLIHRIRVEEL